MKGLTLILGLFISAGAFAQSATDEFLLPENFFAEKGQAETVHLFNGEGLKPAGEVKFHAAAVTKLTLYHGSKDIDLKSTSKEGEPPLLNYPAAEGLSLLQLDESQQVKDYDRDDYVQQLNEQGQDKIAQKLNAGNRLRIREKHIAFLKTLFSSENGGGRIYEKQVHADYEIVLKQNPYKSNYGDDITGVLYFKGQPAKVAKVQFYIRAQGGTIFRQDLSTDNSGEFFIKLSREGVYMLASSNIETSTTSGTDVDAWYTSYTFAFSSSNAMPNTYREFGFGNMH